MIVAIGLERTEKKLQAELLAKKTALQSQGKTEEPGVPTAKPTEAKPSPAPSQAAPTPAKQPSSPAGLTREQKIQRFIEFNKDKPTPTRDEAIQFLRKAGQI
jgi:hypothetical protein